jgi:phenylalanyl-tRNA synthetase alpha chain
LDDLHAHGIDQRVSVVPATPPASGELNQTISHPNPYPFANARPISTGRLQSKREKRDVTLDRNANLTLAERIDVLAGRLTSALEGAADAPAIESIRVAFLGRSGEINQLRRSIGSLPPAERPGAGKLINDRVTDLEAVVEGALGRVRLRELDSELAQSIDVTFPGTPPRTGSLHPIRSTMRDAMRYFERRGFAIVIGPEIDDEFHTFDALNIPSDHPSREGFDSMYLGGGLLLRPHTSPMQIRTMEKHPAPVAILAPGRCYRRDAVDARHSYMFHQIEGLLVAPGINFGHLKGMLAGMCSELFGGKHEIRFRPSFFPFTEPSAEVDVQCPACDGAGCKTCSGSGWIELGGCGMVHPSVLTMANYDPQAVSGWAFGFGVERVAMKRYNIDDIRVLFENDPAVLEALA